MTTRTMKHIGKQSTHDDPAANENIRTRIEERAYCLYEQRNREDGHALEDWLQAEREILNEESK